MDQTIDTAEIMQKIAPVADKVEQLRKTALADVARAKAACIKVIIVALLAAGIGAAIAATVSTQAILIAVIASLVLGIVVCIIVYGSIAGKSTEAFNYAYKTEVIGAIAKALQPGMNYHPNRGITEQEFNTIGHYSRPDRYESEDLFEGHIEKTAIKFSEVHAEDRRERKDKDGNREIYYVTIFKGIVFIADFNKHFNTWVTITPDRESDGFLGRIGQKIQALGGNLVKMENPEFERHFLVRSPDDVEARYILTPDMQDRLLDLRAKMNAKIKLSFEDSLVNISITKSQDWFESNIKESLTEDSAAVSVASQMNHLFQIVDILNLNNRIWTKE